MSRPSSIGGNKIPWEMSRPPTAQNNVFSRYESPQEVNGRGRITETETSEARPSLRRLKRPEMASPLLENIDKLGQLEEVDTTNKR